MDAARRGHVAVTRRLRVAVLGNWIHRHDYRQGRLLVSPPSVCDAHNCLLFEFSDFVDVGATYPLDLVRYATIPRFAFLFETK
jgi:hypothetical protein